MILTDTKKQEIERLYQDGFGIASISLRLKLPQSWVDKYVRTHVGKRNKRESFQVRDWHELRILR